MTNIRFKKYKLKYKLKNRFTSKPPSKEKISANNKLLRIAVKIFLFKIEFPPLLFC